MKQRKVLFIISSLTNGGAERQLALLASHLPAGWEGWVWAFGGGTYAHVLREDGIQVSVRERRARFDPRPGFSLWRDILQWRPDVVHVWDWMGSAAAGPLCKALNIPLVDGTIRQGSKLSRRAGAQGWLMRWSDYVIANSRAGLAAWTVGSDRGRVIYNGFDWRRLPPAQVYERRSSFPFTVVMVARMEPRKDFGTFFTAARLLATADEGAWRFLAVGHGPRHTALVDGAGDLVAARVLEFPDAGMEVLPIVRQAHVGVLMSNALEGCSNALLEYMACGLPVVCSAGGGSDELVLDGVTGFVVPARDAQALADRLTYLRDHPTRAQRMGEAGRGRVQERFSVEIMVRQTLAVYDNAIRRRARLPSRLVPDKSESL